MKSGLGAYPNAASNLPANRAARWWNLTNGGLQSADLTFKYLPGDITAGSESGYRAYRIPTGGGAAAMINSTINPAAKTVSVPNVSEFSDWTLAQVAPTAATVTVGGRVTLGKRGITNVRLTLTDENGSSRTVLTSQLGYYRFAEVEAGKTYTIEAAGKKHLFSHPVQVRSIVADTLDVDFSADN